MSAHEHLPGLLWYIIVSIIIYDQLESNCTNQQEWHFHSSVARNGGKTNTAKYFVIPMLTLIALDHVIHVPVRLWH